MTNHQIRYLGTPAQGQARCSCGKKSDLGDYSDTQAWIYDHQQAVERIRAQLGGRSPTLRSQYTWFSEQAADDDNPATERALWKQLADELEHYVTKVVPVIEQDMLF